MRARNIKKNFWLNREEASILKKKAKKAGLTEADFVRCLVMNVVIKEKPDERFYDVIKELRAIGNNLNQIAYKANATGNIDSHYYKQESEKWNDLIIKIKKEYIGREYISSN